MKSCNKGIPKWTYNSDIRRIRWIKSYLQRLLENNVVRMSGGFLTGSWGNVHVSRFIVSTVKFCWVYLCVVKCCHQVATYLITEHPLRSGAGCLPFLRWWLPTWRCPARKCINSTATSYDITSLNTTSDPNCFESPKWRRRFRASKLAASDLFIKKSQPDFSSVVEEHNM